MRRNQSDAVKTPVEYDNAEYQTWFNNANSLLLLTIIIRMKSTNICKKRTNCNSRLAAQSESLESLGGQHLTL